MREFEDLKKTLSTSKSTPTPTALSTSDELNLGEAARDGNVLDLVGDGVDLVGVREHEDHLEAGRLGRLRLVGALRQEDGVRRVVLGLRDQLLEGLRRGELAEGGVELFGNQGAQVAVAGLLHELLGRLGPPEKIEVIERR